MQSWVNREYSRGLRMHPRGPGGRCVVTYPYHLGVAIRKSRIQLQREVFSPRVLHLVLSFEGTMVLNAEV